MDAMLEVLKDDRQWHTFQLHPLLMLIDILETSRCSMLDVLLADKSQILCMLPYVHINQTQSLSSLAGEPALCLLMLG